MVQFLQLKRSNVMDMKAKQELLRMFSDDIDRVIDKKLGDYGFCSENI